MTVRSSAAHASCLTPALGPGLGALFWLGALSLWPAGRAGAQDPFAQADAIDEISLARLAEERGDAALRARLRDTTQRTATLIAVRASPHARAPEALLVALAQLACGRDPVLAPEAARALFQSTARLSSSALSGREVLRSDLASARDALACSDKKPLPRADIRSLISHVRAALDALLG
jgi:hypothetical protein